MLHAATSIAFTEFISSITFFGQNRCRCGCALHVQKMNCALLSQLHRLSKKALYEVIDRESVKAALVTATLCVSTARCAILTHRPQEARTWVLCQMRLSPAWAGLAAVV